MGKLYSKGVLFMTIMGRTTFMRKDNRGVSLIELITVVAIITTLSGLITPQLMKYVAQKREMACQEHREAIVNVCEKMVYGRQYPVSGLNGLTLDETNIGLLPASVPSEYKEDLKRHAQCPDGGTMRLTTSGVTVICTCSFHSGSVSTDLTTWSGHAVSSEDPPVRP